MASSIPIAHASIPGLDRVPGLKRRNADPSAPAKPLTPRQLKRKNKKDRVKAYKASHRRWLPKWYHRPQMLAWQLLAAHVGLWAVGMIYFIFLQVRYSVGDHGILINWGDMAATNPKGQFTVWYAKDVWDNLPSYLGFHTYAWWDWWRHAIRAVGEGLLGSLLVMSVTVVALMLVPKRGPEGVLTRRWRDGGLGISTRDQKRRTTPLQMAASPFLSILYGVPGFIIGCSIFVLIPFVAGKGLAAHGHSFLSEELNAFMSKDDLQYKVVGVIASFVFARWVFMKVAADIQLHFVENRIRARIGPNDTARKAPFYYWILFPPTFVLYHNYVAESDEVTEIQKHSRASSIAVSLASVILLALAIGGFWLFYHGPAAAAALAAASGH